MKKVQFWKSGFSLRRKGATRLFQLREQFRTLGERLVKSKVGSALKRGVVRWSAHRKRYLSWKNKLRDNLAVRSIFIMLAVLYPLFALLLAEYAGLNDLPLLAERVVTNALPYLPGLLMTVFLYVLVIFLTRRVWLAGLISGVPFLALGIATYYKMITRNAPVLPADLLLADHMGDLTGFIENIPIPTAAIVGVLALTLYLMLLAYLSGPVKIKTEVRYVTSCVLCICVLIFPRMQATDQLLETFQIDSSLSYNQQLNYKTHGLLGSFLVNANQLNVKGVEGMDLLDAITAFQQEDGLSTDFEKPDVIVILSEAFWDPKQLTNVTFSKNPTENYERLAQEGISGHLVSPTYGGGTVQAEFEVLSGLTVARLPDGCIPYEQYVDAPVPTLASYLKSFDYATKAIHTFRASFYGRDQAYPLLGFDSFQGMEEIPIPYELRGGYVPDDVFVDWMIRELENAEGPTFIMGMTMENHGPYNQKFAENRLSATATKAVDEENLDQIVNLADGVYGADQALGKLTDYLRTRERPTVLLYFGDHLPLLGQEYSGYVQGGYVTTGDTTRWTEDENLRMHANPFLIWSNYKSEPASYPYVSPYHLSSLLLNYAGAPKNSLYRFLDVYRSKLPVSKAGLILDTDGNFLPADQLTEAQQMLLDQHWLFTYELLIEKNDELLK